MDLRVLVLTADDDLGTLIGAHVENLGCSSSRAATYDDGSTALAWADVAVVDLVGDGIDDLYRLRLEAPLVQVIAIAPDLERAETARASGARRVLLEPFSIADVVDALRAMGSGAKTSTVDLRSSAGPDAMAVADAPWWATR